VYRWQGRLCEDHECVLIAKTTAARRTALMRRIRALHAYACPCIVALPIVAGHRPFLEWLAANTAAAAPQR
jgi:periplasmic divalent cation tolerance protein